MFAKRQMFRVRVDGWLYQTEDMKLSYNIKDAYEMHDLKEAYDRACEIPHSDVVIIKNKKGKVEFIHIERLHLEGDSHWK